MYDAKSISPALRHASANDLWLCAQESALGRATVKPRIRLTTLLRGQPRRRRSQVGVWHEDIPRAYRGRVVTSALLLMSVMIESNGVR